MMRSSLLDLLHVLSHEEGERTLNGARETLLIFMSKIGELSNGE